MFLHGECRGFPPAHLVAGSALAFVGPFCKLTIMRIGLVTIHALRENQRLLKVPVCVALRAVHAGMFSFERVLRLRMIKALANRGERYFLPARGAVAGGAALGKGSAMRIFVAI